MKVRMVWSCNKYSRRQVGQEYISGFHDGMHIPTLVYGCETPVFRSDRDI